MRKGTFVLSSNVLLLGLVSFFADLSSELYFAVLPFFILELGGGGIVIGIIAGVTDAFVSFLKTIFGFLADSLRAKKKVYVYWGYGIPAVFKVIMSFSRNWQTFLSLRLLERTGKGVRTAPRDALIVDSSPEGTVGRSFGFHRAMDSFGALLGSTLALILILWFTMGYREIIFWSGVLGFLAVVPILFVKEEQRESRKEGRHAWRDFFHNGTKPGYWQVNLVVTLHGLSLISYMFLILNASRVVGDSFGLTGAQIGISYYIYFNLVYTATSYWAGSLADRRGRILPLKIGFTIYLLSLSVFAFTDSPLLLTTAFTLYGVAYGLNEGNIRALPSQYINEGHRPSGYGVYHGIFGISILVGNLVAGVIFEYSDRGAFVLPAIFSFFAIIMISRLEEREFRKLDKST